MSENDVDQEHVLIGLEEGWDLEIDSGARIVHEDTSPGDLMTMEGEGIQGGNKDAGGKDEGVEGENAERVEVNEKEDAEGKSKEHKDAETGDKRERPADLDVEVQKGEGQKETGAKKAKVAAQDMPGKKKRQAKTEAKAKIQATEAPTKKRGPGRPKKSSSTNKKADVDVEGGQKPEAIETAKSVN